MGVRKLLIADGSEEFCLALADMLKGSYEIRTCREGSEALRCLHSYQPDILVLDLMIPGMDGLSVLQEAEGECPAVLVLTRLLNRYVIDALERLGVAYIMVKPCNMRAVVSRVADLAGYMQSRKAARHEERITDILQTLGMKASLDGSRYLKEAVPLLARDATQSVTKELYPAVAKSCGCTSVQVERSIRSAIQSAWKNRDERVWRLYFSPDRQGTIPKPTNSEFILRLAEELPRGK